MPVEVVSTADLRPGGEDLTYYLVVLDGAGQERRESPGLPTSHLAADALTLEPVTDVFVFSHGWLTDLPDARACYVAWMRSMVVRRPTQERLERVRPGFRPLLLGMHWPSKPWGYERLDGPTAYGSARRPSEPPDAIGWLAETPRAREAIEAVTAIARGKVDAFAPPRELLDAYEVLIDEAGLEARGPGALPEADHDPFDPELILREAAHEFAAAVSYGGGARGAEDAVLAVPRVLSFWKMKRHARLAGQAGGAELLTALHGAAPPGVRFHLIGHSFGCVVVSAMLATASTATPSPRPAHSVVLLQGALSLWSYAAHIPARSGQPGYFHSIVRDRRVAGSIVTTQSRHDYVLRLPYSLGVRPVRQVDYRQAKPPSYGAVGRFGLVGEELGVSRENMKDVNTPYTFAPGGIYNLESSACIFRRKRFDRVVGAHSDLSHPAVAHAVWSAALASASPTTTR